MSARSQCKAAHLPPSHASTDPPSRSPGNIVCFDAPEEEAAFFNGTIETHGIEMTGNFTDEQDLATLRAQAPIMQDKYTELGTRCASRPNGNFLQYVGTAATVRDIVGLADALDGPSSPVNYIGLSYGTIIGSWLINMFPEVWFSVAFSSFYRFLMAP